MDSTYIIIILFIGILLVTNSLTRASIKCPKQKIIYRFIPRTFDEELANEVPVTKIFETMFSQPSPWLGSIQNYDKRKQESINKYFVSQS
jgi:hypothetical protein